MSTVTRVPSARVNASGWVALGLERRAPAGGQRDGVLQHQHELRVGGDRRLLDQPAGVLAHPGVEHPLAHVAAQVGDEHTGAVPGSEPVEVRLLRGLAVVHHDLVGQVHHGNVGQLRRPDRGRVALVARQGGAQGVDRVGAGVAVGPQRSVQRGRGLPRSALGEHRQGDHQARGRDHGASGVVPGAQRGEPGTPRRRDDVVRRARSGQRDCDPLALALQHLGDRGGAPAGREPQGPAEHARHRRCTPHTRIVSPGPPTLRRPADQVAGRQAGRAGGVGRVRRRASAARTAGCRRCGSSPPHRGCRCAARRRTRPPSRRASWPAPAACAAPRRSAP